MGAAGDFWRRTWPQAGHLTSLRPWVSGSWLHPRKQEAGSMGYGQGKKYWVFAASKLFSTGRTRVWQSVAGGAIPPVLFIINFLKPLVQKWTREKWLSHPKDNEVCKINIFLCQRPQKDKQGSVWLAVCWLVGIPRCEEVHPLPKHHAGGVSVETHSAVSHLHHRAVQRKRQGELFSACQSFAL